jgi:predicted amidohydrolase
MTTLTVATVQFTLRPEKSVDDFLAHLDGLTALAVDRGADLVVFPELASTGLLACIDDHEVTSRTIASDYWDVLSGFYEAIAAGVRSLARTRGVIVLGGSHIRLAEDGSLRNTAVLAYPDGQVITQDKLHLTPQEHELGMRGGDSVAVATIGAFTAGVLICADIQFPELSRYLVAKGADLILCPSLTWNRRGVHRVRTGCSARAMENQLYVVMSPLIGSDGLPADAPIHAAGAALVTAPVDRTVGINDGILGRLDGTEEDVLIVDLDHDLLVASRAKPEAPGLALQRPDLYAALRADLAGV